VAIVISAASRTGAAICRELLSRNASVLGIDSVPLQKEGPFNGDSSFLFVRYEANAVPSGSEVVQVAQEIFKSERIDWLINVVEETEDPKGILQPTGRILAVMEERRSGLLLNVLGGSLKKGAPQQTMLVGNCLAWIYNFLYLHEDTVDV
jgi:hypothetical protein